MDFICFDTEDDSPERMARGQDAFSKQVTQIAALTSSGADFYSKGPDTSRFKRWLRDRPEEIVYAHNCQYDLGNLFGETLDALDVTMVRGRFIKARWNGLQFRDSFNLWPMRLKSIGEVFGMAKGKLDVRSKAYVFRDVEILREAVNFFVRFCSDNGLDTVPTTLGGVALALWRGWGGTNCMDTSDLSRRALYGGRVELFQPEAHGRIEHTDINSLYPSTMRGTFPGPLEPWPKRLGLPQTGVAEVSVRVPNTSLPVLPWRREDGTVLYACGRFRGVWTIPEIALACGRGATIERLWQALGARETLVPYGDYVTRVYERRQAAKTKAERLVWKLCLNNLYGRLGSTGVISRSVLLTDRTARQGTPYGSKCLVDYAMPLDGSTNWAHAAYITAMGRCELWRAMADIGAERMIYADTDGTVFERRPGEKMPFPLGAELGQMKHEGTYRHCQTFAPKAYRLGRMAKAKGVPSRLADEFLRTGRAEFELPFKLREAILFYDRENSRQLSVWHRVVKERRSIYDRKRLVGGRYEPLTLNRA